MRPHKYIQISYCNNFTQFYINQLKIPILNNIYIYIYIYICIIRNHKIPTRIINRSRTHRYKVVQSLIYT
ncbi:MAG: hypothetical protein MCS20_01735, partial [Candidatus Phytoplasma mali]|nr:hypothetical protein [Candidatus Phytoplasma australiense]MCG7202113.1 hypothetical protein [Candidatus Phytoplasma mali]MCZ8632577.1 hypothetical protein [Spiroplasma sp. Tabriz.8]